MLVDRIQKDDCANGFLLDGFPRNLDQGKALDDANISIDLVLYLSIKEEEIISRMSGRRVHLASGRSYHILHNPPKKDGFDDVTGEALIQREDDNPEVIKKRLSVYYKETEPLLEFYKNKNLKFIFKKLQEGIPGDKVAARCVGGCVRKHLSSPMKK